MKKILLALFTLLSVLTSYAQIDFRSPTNNFDQYWTIGVRYGITQLHGDIRDTSFVTRLKESRPSFGISLSRQITPYLSFSADLSQSGYYGRNRKIHWNDSVYYVDLSVTGKITMLGVSGTLNINKLIDKESGDNWHAFVSAGFGYSGWNCTVKDEYNSYLYKTLTGKDTSIIVARVKNSTYNNFTKNETVKLGISSKLYSSLAFGAHFQISDRIGVKVEHSVRFSGSDLLDGCSNGPTDMVSLTTIGITFKLQQIGAAVFQPKTPRVKSIPSTPKISTSYGRTTPKASTTTKVYSLPQEKPVKAERRTSFRNSTKIKPELQDYIGYNALLPPPTPKVDTTSTIKVLKKNINGNIWVSESDSGRYEITGGKDLSNVAFHTTDPQTETGLQTGIVPTYRIQIQASKTYISVDTVLKKLGLKEKVSVELRSDGWYRYYVGQFAKLPEAKAKLATMRAKGIKDAFIVSFKTNTQKAIK